MIPATSVRCPICGSSACACGPRTEVTPVDQRIQEAAVGGKLKLYDVTVNGYETRMRLTEDEAKRRGARSVDDTDAATKTKPASNKARTTKNK